MISELRKEIILNTLNDKGILYTHAIMKKCNVSDLAELESKGLLIRTHGGAIKSKAADMLFTYDLRINQNRQNKEAIYQLAAKFSPGNFGAYQIFKHPFVIDRRGNCQ
jgi:DeoR family fructose operon transcriptional repressor